MLQCIWVKRSQSSSGWGNSPRIALLVVRVKHRTARQWVWADAHSVLKGKWMSSTSKLNLGFAEVSCILAYSSKAEQRLHAPSEVPQKLWKWPSSSAAGKGRFLLLSHSFATLVRRSVVVRCENNGWVSPEISQEVFLAEKYALSLCSDRKIALCLWPTWTVYLPWARCFKIMKLSWKYYFAHIG